MSDLVERLRRRTQNLTCTPVDGGLLDEAATEIERLTAALASEREACALVAEQHGAEYTQLTDGMHRTRQEFATPTTLRELTDAIGVHAKAIASAIRARGKEI